MYARIAMTHYPLPPFTHTPQILEAVQRLLNLLGPDSPALYPLVLPLLQYSLNINNPEVGRRRRACTGLVGGQHRPSGGGGSSALARRATCLLGICSQRCAGPRTNTPVAA